MFVYRKFTIEQGLKLNSFFGNFEESGNVNTTLIQDLSPLL